MLIAQYILSHGIRTGCPGIPGIPVCPRRPLCPGGPGWPGDPGRPGLPEVPDDPDSPGNPLGPCYKQQVNLTNSLVPMRSIQEAPTNRFFQVDKLLTLFKPTIKRHRRQM